VHPELGAARRRTGGGPARRSTISCRG
jgi:hypothetical protein